MKIDLSKCEIKSPAGAELDRLCSMLSDVFKIDVDVFKNVVNSKYCSADWTPYSLYHEGEIAGNVSVVKMRVWLDGKKTDVFGIGSVATPERFRKNGIAKLLMRHALTEIDQAGLPALLFTDLPMVYESQGFKTVEQGYRMFDVAHDVDCRAASGIEYLENIDGENLAGIKNVYENIYPDYNGKLVRNDQNWEYRARHYNAAKSQIAVFRDDAGIAGYINTEYSPDRVTLTEFCCAPDNATCQESLLNAAIALCKSKNHGIISLAFGEAHFIGDLLDSQGIITTPETGIAREIFMARGPRGEGTEHFNRLCWPLADKF